MASDIIAINADVYEQDVMMIGSVETSKQCIEAGGRARSVEDVTGDIGKQKGAVENSSTIRLSKARRMPCYSMRTAQMRPTSDGDR